GRGCCAACEDLVDKRLRANAHVKRVRVNGDRGIACVDAEAGTVSIDELSAIAGECCGAASPVPLPDATVSSHHHAHTAKPGTGAHAPEAHAVANAEDSGMAHAGHDLSDPGMPAAMEADMRQRFWISLVLAMPVIAYSSLGTLLLRGRVLPTPFGIPSE